MNQTINKGEGNCELMPRGRGRASVREIQRDYSLGLRKRTHNETINQDIDNKTKTETSDKRKLIKRTKLTISPSKNQVKDRTNVERDNLIKGSAKPAKIHTEKAKTDAYYIVKVDSDTDTESVTAEMEVADAVNKTPEKLDNDGFLTPKSSSGKKSASKDKRKPPQKPKSAGIPLSNKFGALTPSPNVPEASKKHDAAEGDRIQKTS